jgi:hypothetical protein
MVCTRGSASSARRLASELSTSVMKKDMARILAFPVAQT